MLLATPCIFSSSQSRIRKHFPQALVYPLLSAGQQNTVQDWEHHAEVACLPSEQGFALSFQLQGRKMNAAQYGRHISSQLNSRVYWAPQPTSSSQRVRKQSIEEKPSEILLKGEARIEGKGRGRRKKEGVGRKGGTERDSEEKPQRQCLIRAKDFASGTKNQ